MGSARRSASLPRRVPPATAGDPTRWPIRVCREINLRGVHLRDANLTEARLVDADLSGANLTGANLTKAKLGGADLTCARTDDLTRWPVGVARPAPCD
ncbi:pentapeptide repeat-containing protein [Micromonospora olivasterospora]|uniref:pentapeptide repeat-containing protein n=1 Tax=Micromonospora olivasterospora TaxID=1880 RepID=UPI001B874DE4